MPQDDKEFSSCYDVSSLIHENLEESEFHRIVGYGVNFHLEFLCSK